LIVVGIYSLTINGYFRNYFPLILEYYGNFLYVLAMLGFFLKIQKFNPKLKARTYL